MVLGAAKQEGVPLWLLGTSTAGCRGTCNNNNAIIILVVVVVTLFLLGTRMHDQNRLAGGGGDAPPPKQVGADGGRQEAQDRVFTVAPGSPQQPNSHPVLTHLCCIIVLHYYYYYYYYY